MKIARVVGCVLALVFFEWSPCFGQESSSSPTNFSTEKRTENSEAVFNMLYDYKMPDISKKFSFEQLVQQQTISSFERHGRFLARGRVPTIQEMFENSLKRHGLDPKDFILLRVQGIVYNAHPNDMTWWFAFIPKEIKGDKP